MIPRVDATRHSGRDGKAYGRGPNCSGHRRRCHRRLRAHPRGLRRLPPARLAIHCGSPARSRTQLRRQPRGNPQGARYGADVVEADVILVNSTLYAGHDPPLPLIGRRFFRGPKLEEIWLEADAAEAIKLDLKESTPS